MPSCVLMGCMALMHPITGDDASMDGNALPHPHRRPAPPAPRTRRGSPRKPCLAASLPACQPSTTSAPHCVESAQDPARPGSPNLEKGPLPMPQGQGPPPPRRIPDFIPDDACYRSLRIGPLEVPGQISRTFHSQLHNAAHVVSCMAWLGMVPPAFFAMCI